MLKIRRCDLCKIPPVSLSRKFEIRSNFAFFNLRQFNLTLFLRFAINLLIFDITFLARMIALTIISGPAIGIELTVSDNFQQIAGVAEQCEPDDYPDAPARAFRAANGSVHLISSHYTTRSLISTDGVKFTKICSPNLLSRKSADPGEHSYLWWLTSTWTDDGINVFALLHNEYHAAETGKCSYNDGFSCWYNSIVSANSTDAGQTFLTDRPVFVVAAPSFKQNVAQGRNRGFFNPSNIVSYDGLLYVLVYTTGGGAQKPGVCVLRSDNRAKLHDWQAFDGRGFNVKLLDPYRAHNGETQICKALPPFNQPVGAIVRIKQSNTFIATWLKSPSTSEDWGTVMYSESQNLLEWGNPKELVRVPNRFDKCISHVRMNYPSMIDFQSSERNLYVANNEFDLLMVRSEYVNCRPQKRELVLSKIRVIK